MQFKHLTILLVLSTFAAALPIAPVEDCTVGPHGNTCLRTVTPPKEDCTVGPHGNTCLRTVTPPKEDCT
ncbi:hypothetical protein BGZ98_000171, partial [Dissophora globulifera]